MIISLVVMLAITILATFWARELAGRRGRHAGGWTLATAIVPPAVLVLWALPARISVTKA